MGERVSRALFEGLDGGCWEGVLLLVPLLEYGIGVGHESMSVLLEVFCHACCCQPQHLSIAAHRILYADFGALGIIPKHHDLDDTNNTVFLDDVRCCKGTSANLLLGRNVCIDGTVNQKRRLSFGAGQRFPAVNKALSFHGRTYSSAKTIRQSLHELTVTLEKAASRRMNLGIALQHS